MINALEGLLTPAERRVRTDAFTQIRTFVRNVSRPGLPAGTKKSFPKPSRGSIRVDLEVNAGLACVPDENGE
jgi:hypothetical protein